uniref:Uncharacterized protein n=1 Tax=Meloidogyne enterolobii TaxID=390850 RepID=A0A6V7TTY9_MELEN|nr:unnamed protein product [Meloidogyne enterolobii]
MDKENYKNMKKVCFRMFGQIRENIKTRKNIEKSWKRQVGGKHEKNVARDVGHTQQKLETKKVVREMFEGK